PAYGLIAAQHRVQAQQEQPLAILKRVQDLRATGHNRQQPTTRVEAAPKLASGLNHQIVLQQTMWRLRYQNTSGAGHALPQHLALVRPGSVGHYHAKLLASTAHARDPSLQGHNLLLRGPQPYQPLQHAIYHSMRDKLSHHHQRQKETKQPETAAK